MMSADVDSWLGVIGLPQYADLFRSNEIDFDMLRRLTSADLLEMGVTALGHRKKLLAAIATLGEERRNLVDAAVHPASSEAERRHLTVMFVDLVGSTAMSSQLDPEEMRELIGNYQNAVAGEISRLKGMSRNFLVTACLPILAGRTPMRTTLSARCVPAWQSRLPQGASKDPTQRACRLV